MATVELAPTYAALILADDGIELPLLAKALEGKDVKDLLLNVGAGGGAPAVGAPAASGGAPAAAAEEAPKEEEKKEEKEESDDDMGFGLFD
ncbi:putative 60S acidic ribosomal protein P1 [Pisolithus marmoratus]|nr:putative 60S acidic ribosomal protein P1 [Pisolithus marmoratus]